jgi:hypothetical protein
MSTSAARIEANRANAQLSTGPRTEEGKLASSSNAITTGLTAAKIFVRPDEQDQFNLFQNDLRTEMKPDGATQSGLFDLVLHAAWNLRRCFELETEIQSEAINKGFTDAVLDDDLSLKLDRIYRYKKMHESSHRRSIADLRKLQTEQLWRNESQECIDASILADTAQVSASVRTSEDAKRKANEAMILEQMEAFCAPPPVSAEVRQRVADRLNKYRAAAEGRS